MSYAVVDHRQGSPAWLNWRHGGIGASDAPALMGENPWRSAQYLFAEKVAPPRFGAPRPRRTPAAIGDLFGAPPKPEREPDSLEAQARRLYCRQTGLTLAPLCLHSSARPWQRASLDGIDLGARRALEIKCGAATYAQTAAARAVPRHYVGQLQHTLSVTGFDAIDFWVWLPGRTPLLLTVARDEDYIARMLAAETAFWERVVGARA